MGLTISKWVISKFAFLFNRRKEIVFTLDDDIESTTLSDIIKQSISSLDVNLDQHDCSFLENHNDTDYEDFDIEDNDHSNNEEDFIESIVESCGDRIISIIKSQGKKLDIQSYMKYVIDYLYRTNTDFIKKENPYILSFPSSSIASVNECYNNCINLSQEVSNDEIDHCENFYNNIVLSIINFIKMLNLINKYKPQKHKDIKHKSFKLLDLFYILKMHIHSYDKDVKIEYCDVLDNFKDEGFSRYKKYSYICHILSLFYYKYYSLTSDKDYECLNEVNIKADDPCECNYKLSQINKFFTMIYFVSGLTEKGLIKSVSLLTIMNLLKSANF